MKLFIAAALALSTIAVAPATAQVRERTVVRETPRGEVVRETSVRHVEHRRDGYRLPERRRVCTVRYRHGQRIRRCDTRFR